MKIEATPQEIAELLQAIVSSQEQQSTSNEKKFQIPVSFCGDELIFQAFNDPTKMPSLDSLYPLAKNDISQEES